MSSDDSSDAFSESEDDHEEADFESLDTSLKMTGDEVMFIKGIRFLLKAGITEKCYRTAFRDSPYYDSKKYPKTLRTLKEWLFKFVQSVIQVLITSLSRHVHI
jgi:hypothetical protein